MPELPEVEVLVRRLQPLLRGQSVRTVLVRRPKVLLPTSPREFEQALCGAKFVGVTRRGKYLLFSLRQAKRGGPLRVLGHLGMTGRMYLLPAREPLPKHAAVVLGLGRMNFVYEDARYFGRFTLDCRSVERLGPEPLEEAFTPESMVKALKQSRQAIKVRLLDQVVLAGVGNIYASEALFHAGISPRTPARRLRREQVRRLWLAIREVLTEAIKGGSTLPLNSAEAGKPEGLFYFGNLPGRPDYYAERLRVYDRAGEPCFECGKAIKRLVQAARSTYYCPGCQTRS